MKKIVKKYPNSILLIDRRNQKAFYQLSGNVVRPSGVIYHDIAGMTVVRKPGDKWNVEFIHILNIEVWNKLLNETALYLRERVKLRGLSEKEFLIFCVLEHEKEELISLIKKFDSMSLKNNKISSLFLMDAVHSHFQSFAKCFKEEMLLDTFVPSGLDDYWIDFQGRLRGWSWRDPKTLPWDMFLSEMEMSAKLFLCPFTNQSDLDKMLKIERDLISEKKGEKPLKNMKVYFDCLKVRKMAARPSGYSFWLGISALNAIGRYALKGLRRKYCFLLAVIMFREFAWKNKAL